MNAEFAQSRNIRLGPGREEQFLPAVSFSVYNLAVIRTYDACKLQTIPFSRMILFDSIFNQKSLDKIAVLFEQRSITYSELREQTLAMIGALHFLKIQRQDRVALLLNDSPEFIASFIAICSHDAIAVPINMALRPDEQRAILNDCSARIAIAEAELADSLLADERLPSLRDVIVVSREVKDFTTEAQRTQRKHREDVQAAMSKKIWWLDELLTETASQAPPMFTAPAVDQPAFIFTPPAAPASRKARCIARRTSSTPMKRIVEKF